MIIDVNVTQVVDSTRITLTVVINLSQPTLRIKIIWIVLAILSIIILLIVIVMYLIILIVLLLLVALTVIIQTIAFRACLMYILLSVLVLAICLWQAVSASSSITVIIIVPNI